MLDRKLGPVWTQVADLKQHTKGKSDHFFIVGVYESQQQIRAVLCKGARFPPVLTPKPAVQILQFKLPLCEGETDKGDMEERFWRTRLLGNYFDYWTSQNYDFDDSARAPNNSVQQENLMKLFALACKTEREYRAADICEMMQSSATIQLAIKYASRLRMLTLAERLTEVARQKQEEEYAKMTQQESEDEDEQPDTSAKPGSVVTTNGYVSMGRSSRRYDEDTNVAADEDDDEPEEMEQEGGDEEEADSDGEDDDEAGGDVLEEIEREREKKKKTPMLKLNKTPLSANTTPKSIAKSQTDVVKRNPFKSSSASTPSQGAMKGTSVFDDMQRHTKSSQKTFDPYAKAVAPVEIKPKKIRKSAHGKLTIKKKDAGVEKESDENKPTEEPAPKKSKKTGFQLWFEEARSDLVADNPGLSDADLAVAAARKFKELDDNQKQRWISKAKTSDAADNKKRKREDSDIDTDSSKVSRQEEGATRTPLSANTNSKLAAFSADS